ncbi:MAG: hypothetical protein R3F62_11325 [Planctomycetota bacterium]
MNCCEDTGRWRAVRGEDAQPAPATSERLPAEPPPAPDAAEADADALLRESAGRPPQRVWERIASALRAEGKIRD